MRLTENTIENITSLIVGALVDKRLVTLKAQRGAVTERIKRVIKEECKKEALLDKEVEALIEKNISVLGKDSIDYGRMFTMVKVKLAKEKGIVL